MQFRVGLASAPAKPCEGAYNVGGKLGYQQDWRIDIGTLEDLMQLVRKLQVNSTIQGVIIDTRSLGKPPELLVYNAFIE